MEIVKCRFVIFIAVISVPCSKTVPLKDHMSFVKKDITELFDKSNQPNKPADEGCGPCVSVNETICPPVMDHDGRQNMTKVNINISFIKAFVTEKIRQELQDQLQSVKDILSANNKLARERDLQVQDQLLSMRESIEDLHKNITSFMRTISDRRTFASVQNNSKIQSKTTVKSETTSVKPEITTVKPEITTVPIINTNCTTVPESGIYTLYLELIMSNVTVYCDQDTDGGGWIVFLRRQDGSVKFDRSWVDYKRGFGSPDGEFWAGNELLYKLTKERPVQLRIDMEDFDGNTAFAIYDEFQVGPESDKYRLHVSGYSGTAGDSLIKTSLSRRRHAGMQFSTFDSDNDKRGGSCALFYEGGWWYNDCGDAKLTQPYSHRKKRILPEGMVWYSWKGWDEALKRVEMKMR